MKTRALIAGLVMAGSLLAQAPVGPRGRGQMGRGGPGGPGRVGQGPVPTVVGAPYSAVEVTTSQQALAAGNSIQRQEQSKVYRDSEGRVRNETTGTGSDGQPETRVTISDPVAAVVYELDAKNKVAYSRPATFLTPLQTAAAIERQRTMGAGQPHAEPEANVKRETLPAQSMHGIMANGTRMTRTIPAGTMGNAQAIEVVRETWTSDELKVPLMTKVSDPRIGTSVTELTNIDRSQPDPSLFQVPPDYKVWKHSGAWRGQVGRAPVATQKQ
jgi:hypothetical protein